jgi:hypothetical protein
MQRKQALKKPPVSFYQRATAELLLPLAPLVIFACVSYVISRPETTPLLLIISKGLVVVTGMALIGALLPIYVLLLLSFCGPLVTISTDGLFLSKFYLRWQDIKCIELRKYWGRTRIFVIMNDPGAFLTSLPRSSVKILRDQFRATGGICVPSVRGYSDVELSSVLEQVRIERKDHHLANSSESPAPYRRRTANENAAAFAAVTFGLYFIPTWFPLMDCVKDGDVRCFVAGLMWASVIGIGTYVLLLVVLSYLYKRFPRLDISDLPASLRTPPSAEGVSK